MLILNDNKISQINTKIGNLTKLEVLLLHNNLIVDVPSSMYRLKNLEQLSLDWFSYLNNDDISIHTKHLKGIDKRLAELTSNKLEQEDAETAAKHQKVINQFLDLCKLVQICEMQKNLEERQQMMHHNPQQDDSEPNAIGTAALPISSNI